MLWLVLHNTGDFTAIFHGILKSSHDFRRFSKEFGCHFVENKIVKEVNEVKLAIKIPIPFEVLKLGDDL